MQDLINLNDLKGLSEVDKLEVDNTSRVNTLHVPQRLEGESFEVYKMRRKVSNMQSKALVTNLFWDTEKLGTFRKGSK